MDAEQEYLLRRMLDAYVPAPAPRPQGEGRPPVIRRWSDPSSPMAIRESLDDYERVFFAEGATLDHVRAVAEPWRASGLTAPEVQQWLDAGVYLDEPELAVALAGAGFAPQEARRATIRYRSDTEVMNVISAVRSRTEQAVWAVELKQRIDLIRETPDEARRAV
ncbi:MAG: hypothetical protein QM779_03460 [Propionicimonas sp.]|uniref:hypothetical protein n=1 Tax=Propionicimonas sp. TaxID=1955623 RepID=UPI003D0EFFEB